MEKGYFIIFCLFFIPFVTMPCCSAAAMAGISPSRIDVSFFPYTEQRINFQIAGYDAIEFEFKCPYVHPINETLNDEDGVSSFSVMLSLPEKIDAEPGEYNCNFILHRPANPDMPQGVSAAAEVGAVIAVHIPVKGRYASISLEAQNANKGEPVYFKVSVNNLGDTVLTGLSAVIDVMDNDGNIKETLHTGTGDAPPFGGVELWKKMETTDYEPARYKAKAVLLYGGENPATAETEFLIGKLFVKYTGMEMNATAGRINPLKVNVESWWGNPIENVRAEFRVFDKNNSYAGEFKTESADLPPWKKASLQGYWDTTGLEAGEYNANLTIRYKGGETMENVALVLQKEQESNEGGRMFEKISSVIASPVFIALLVIILIINISIWVIKQKKQRKKNK